MFYYILFMSLVFVPQLTAEINVFISDSNFSAEVKRDEWGVPHIYGKSDSDVTFGLGYAHSEDDYKTIEDIIFASRGELA